MDRIRQTFRLNETGETLTVVPGRTVARPTEGDYDGGWFPPLETHPATVDEERSDG